MLKLITVPLLFHLLILQVNGIGEWATLNTHISAANPSAECLANQFVRPCPKENPPGAIIELENYPSDFPCPCFSDGGTGGAIIGDGQPFVENPDTGFFVDKVLYDGFINPVDAAFTNTGVMFVATREGVVWHVNLETGARHIFIDLSDEVGMAGDRGMMGIEVHPEFDTNPFVYLLYVVDPVFGPPDEPSERPANQRLIRLEDINGFPNPNYRFALFGGGENDGPPICFNTHAVGAVKFGLDGSLFVSVGEGAHWNFDNGDFGQNEFDSTGFSYDPECEERFGDEQDVGAFRSQIFETLSGKILRIHPGTGEGICAGSGWSILNPFCDGDSNSIPSKIWALGVRNPFRMAVRPLNPGEVGDGPGVVYFGDVGQGGYEELNAVRFPAMNFGWPCWEGPYPCPMYRDSPFNRDPTVNTARINGQFLNCPYMYENMTTILPFFFWSRFHINDDAGYFDENGYLGQNIYGNTAAGVAFYTGTKYPPRYRNAVFILEFSQWWIAALQKDEDDQYISGERFANLDIAEGAKVTLINGPDGDICYITMNAGQIRCFEYQLTNVPPSVSLTASPRSGPTPLTVQFSPDGSFDREDDAILFQWDFGDGIVSNELRPRHTFTTAGPKIVTLHATDQFGNTANATTTIHVGNSAPQVTIVAPTTNAAHYNYTSAQMVSFAAVVVDETPATTSYRWEFQLVHNNHIHPNMLEIFQRNFTININEAGAQSHGADRVNYRIILHVTDSQGLQGSDRIFLSHDGWKETMGNSPPIPSFTTTDGRIPQEVGQPVIFNAQDTADADQDYIFFEWDFGDNTTAEGLRVTHIYETDGFYTITLRAYDNWGESGVTQQTIYVRPPAAIPAVSSISDEEPIYGPFQIVFTSIQQQQAGIYYTLNGEDPTPCDLRYTGPIDIPFIPYYNLTLKVRSFVEGLQGSIIRTYNFQMLPPPCNNIAIGDIGELICVNPVTPLPPGTLTTIPSIPTGVVNTLNPPSDPALVLDYSIQMVNGVFDDSLNQYNDKTNIFLWVNQGSSVGGTITARVQYDFTGDGTWDRTETFHDFACDPIPTTWEEYTFFDPATRFPLASSIQGSLAYLPLQNGTIRLLVWQSIGFAEGTESTQLKTGDAIDLHLSHFRIPYKDTFIAQDFGNAEIPVSTTTSGDGSCPIIYTTTGDITTGQLTTGSTSTSGTSARPIITSASTTGPRSTIPILSSSSTGFGSVTTSSGSGTIDTTGTSTSAITTGGSNPSTTGTDESTTGSEEPTNEGSTTRDVLTSDGITGKDFEEESTGTPITGAIPIILFTLLWVGMDFILRFGNNRRN